MLYWGCIATVMEFYHSIKLKRSDGRLVTITTSYTQVSLTVLTNFSGAVNLIRLVEY